MSGFATRKTNSAIRKHRLSMPSLLYSTAALKLNTFVVESFVVFLSSPFCADRTNGRRLKGLKPKEQRARHTGIPVSLFFVQELLLQYPSVEKSLPLKLFLLIFGAPELVRLAL